MTDKIPGTFLATDYDLPSRGGADGARFGRAILRDQPEAQVSVEVGLDGLITYAFDWRTHTGWLAGYGQGQLHPRGTRDDHDLARWEGEGGACAG